MSETRPTFEPTWSSAGRLAAGLSFEALRAAGWSPEELTRILEGVQGVTVTPLGSDRYALAIEWVKEPLEPDMVARIQAEAPLFLLALTRGDAEPQVV